MNNRKALEQYWQQFNPLWTIPMGFHVHHIVPRHRGGTDEPTNLIAVHPDDHVSLHRQLGDKILDNGFILAIKFGEQNVAKRHEVRKKISDALTGRQKTEEHKQNISKARAQQDMSYRLGVPRTEETKDKIRKANIGKIYSIEVNKSKGRVGAENAASKSVTVNGKQYKSIKEAMSDTGMSRERIRKYL